MNKITEAQVIEKLKTIKDPELGIDVWTLGLVYKITIDDEGIEILMTLTSPFCPFADELIKQVEQTLAKLFDPKDKISAVRVELTFEPAWEPSEELRMQLGV
jgi:metal-sulfur cluster biosynthetic enzyme